MTHTLYFIVVLKLKNKNSSFCERKMIFTFNNVYCGIYVRIHNRGGLSQKIV